jgi:hypothetical protein
MEPITLEHVRKAAEWAKNAVETCPLGGTMRRYDQSDDWDCGTKCCMWGAASIIAGCGSATKGPSDEWAAQSHIHVVAAGIMRSGMSTPDQMLNFMTRANLFEANLFEADLSGTNLSEANLTRADLSEANLSGALIKIGNAYKRLA